MQYFILNMEQLHHIQRIENFFLHPQQTTDPMVSLDCQLIYVLDGTIEAQVAEEQYTASRNAILFLPTQIPHILTATEGQVTAIRIGFSASAALGRLDNTLCSLQECLEHMQYFAFHYVIERLAHIPLFIDSTTGLNYRSLVDKMYSHFYAPSPGTNLLAKSLLHQLLSVISADNAAACLDRANMEAGNTLAIQKIREYLNTNYTRKVGLEELSEMSHLSTNYLCSRFKENTGMSIVQYLNARRMEAAKVYLVSTNCRIQDVAQTVGISDEFYFCRLFKKETGFTPSAFRKKFRVQRRWLYEKE